MSLLASKQNLLSWPTLNIYSAWLKCYNSNQTMHSVIVALSNETLIITNSNETMQASGWRISTGYTAPGC